jgi:hypothetical protein
MLLGINVFIPMPAVAEIEVDSFQSSEAQMELSFPDGASRIVDLSGSQTWAVDLGSLSDGDGNSREEVQAQITAMDLTGSHADLGLVSIGPNPSRVTIGQIEETSNAIPGTLDIPPFAPSGTADSFFDVFFEIEFFSQTFHNHAPIPISGVITHKPPAEGEELCGSGPVELFDENENPTGIFVTSFCNTPNTDSGGVGETEVDTFTSSLAQIEIVDELGVPTVTNLTGTQTWEVELSSLGDPDGNGQEQVQTEIVAMELVGTHPVYGLITVGVNPLIPSEGQIEEDANALPGTLDIPPFAPHGTGVSSFDVFFEVEVASLTLGNSAPLGLSGTITHKPPAEGETLCSSGEVQLLDQAGVPTGLVLSSFCNTPNSGTSVVVEIEVDEFPDSELEVQMASPGGVVEVLVLTGPTVVEVNLTDPRDTDGNGQDQVETEIVSMNLQGSSPALGTVTVRISPTQRTVGEIEENENNNPGVLDIQPFAPSGTADSFFDVFFEIEVPGIVLHNEVPALIEAVNLTHKPPAEGERFCGNVQLQLFDENGNPAPFGIADYCFTPNPEPSGGNGGDDLGCTLSQGFWKNHPDDWPSASLNLGNETYLKGDLVDLLKTPVRGDASLILAKQLIAAKLNVANGSNASSVDTTIDEADDWLSSLGGRLPLGVHPSSDTGQNLTRLAEPLDEYNNGLLPGGPPHCDTLDEEGQEDGRTDPKEPKEPKEPGQPEIPSFIWILATVIALVAIVAWVRVRIWK